MKRLAKILVVSLSFVIVGTALLFVPQKNANGAAKAVAASVPPVVCRPVHGTIHSLFTTQNCTSPIGLCTAGTISDSGILDGATTFLALGAAPSAGMPSNEPSANLSYSGQLTITASNGTLITHDCSRRKPSGFYRDRASFFRHRDICESGNQRVLHFRIHC